MGKVEDGSLSFNKVQTSTDAVRNQMRDLGHKIGKKLEQELKPIDIKPSVMNQQCVVYFVSCDLCDLD